MAESTVRLEDTDAIGGDGGGRFWHARPGVFLKKLRFWWNDDVMRGVELTLTDGTTRSHGVQEGTDAVSGSGRTRGSPGSASTRRRPRPGIAAEV